MKGIVFTQFLELVEQRHGLALVDRVLEGADLAHGGAYTAVGTYDDRELVRLVELLADALEARAEDVLRDFGRHLFGRLAQAHPHFLEGTSDPLELLTRVEDGIHAEVRKLYADAQLPTFRSSFPEEGTLDLLYESPRALDPLAEGLILGCADHFGTELRVERHGECRPGHTTFRVRHAAA